jgi:hypothetical protein
MIQCFPITDFLMLVFSSIRVDSPIIESEEIVAFWSIRDRFLESEVRVYVLSAINWVCCL